MTPHLNRLVKTVQMRGLIIMVFMRNKKNCFTIIIKYSLLSRARTKLDLLVQRAVPCRITNEAMTVQGASTVLCFLAWYGADRPFKGHQKAQFSPHSDDLSRTGVFLDLV